MKIFKKLFLFVLIIFVFVFMFGVGTVKADDENEEEPLILSNGSMVYYSGTNDPVMLPTKYTASETYFRGVWVTPLCDNLPSCSDSSVASYKKEVLKMFDIMEYFNLNALVFHVRIFNDALFESSLNPRSNYMTTSQDMLGWVIEEAHKRGIEFHAWFNPYRVYSSGGSIEKAVEKYKDYPQNPASKAENLLANDSGGVILNPGLPEVRQFIIDSCMEVVNRYDIDAVHFDDYFYISNVDDSSTREKYNTENLSLDDFRRKQVDTFIEDLHNTLVDYNTKNNKRVQLGISPSGIYRNGDGKVTYDEKGHAITNGSKTSGFAHYGNYLYSDTLKWANEGWIDYLLPQSYWAFSHTVAGFGDVMGWWDKAMKNLDCKLYSGMGIYMAESPGSNYSWGFDPYEAANQVLYTTALEKAEGTCFFDLDSLTYTYENRGNDLYDRGLNSIRLEYWSKKAILPVITNMPLQEIDPIRNLEVKKEGNNNVITFNKSNNAKFYIVYRSDKPLTYSADEVLYIFGADGSLITYTDEESNGKDYNYGVVAQSHSNNLSEPREFNMIKYEVKFFDSDNNLLKSELVEAGKSATPPSDPQLVGKTFVGWSRSFSNVTSDINLYPKYNDSLFTVNFYNSDGSLLKTVDVNYHGSAEAPEVTKVGYTFVGWSEDFSDVIYDMDIYPIFEKKKCTVTFLDWDGTELYSYEITAGKAAYTPEDPERRSYKFIGWDKEVGIILDDTIFTAQYEPVYFVVTFVCDIDNSIISTESVLMYGSATLPTPPEVNGYRFMRWQGNYTNVNYNSTVKAIYDEILYLVTIYDYEGNVIVPEFEYFLADGYTMPTPATIDGKEFVKWDHDINNLTNEKEEVSIRPLYRANGSKVTFKLSTGEGLGTYNLDNNTTYPELPELEGLTFIGWDKDLSDLLESGTITAIYKAFTVTYLGPNDEVIDVKKVTGSSLDYYPEAPNLIGKKFIGWERVDMTNITSDLVVHAIYEDCDMIVDFYDYYGKVVETKKFDAGTSIIYPELDPVEGHTLREWEVSINGDKVKAKAIYDVFTVTYYGLNNEVIEVKAYTEHSSSYFPTVIGSDGFKFIGWDNDLTNLNGDVECHALFEEATLTVLYYDYYGNLITEEKVKYGERASYDIEIPEVKGYEFKGFDYNDPITENNTEINLLYEKLASTKSGCNKATILYELFIVLSVIGLALITRKKH